MKKILVPVDGSPSSQRAVAHAIALLKSGSTSAIELLNVQPPILSGNVRQFVSREMVDGYHRSQSEAALGPALDLLNESRVRCNADMVVGHIAQTIVEQAGKRGCDAIVMGTRGMGGVANLVLGSIAMKVIVLAECPVTLVK